MVPLIATGPADFTNPVRPGAYFGVDLEIAQHYANYAKRRVPAQEVVILRMELPNEVIEKLSPEEKLRCYWPSKEWQELVWTCRIPTREHSKELARYARYSVALIIGTICGKPDAVIAGLDHPDQISERMVMKSPRNLPAVQYCFAGNAGLEILKQHGAETCSLHLVTNQAPAEF